MQPISGNLGDDHNADGIAQDLNLVIARTGHVRFRQLVDPSHPDYRPEYIPVIQSEAVRFRTESSLPPLASQLRSAFAAAGRITVTTITGQPVLASQEVQERRLAVCQHGYGLSPDQVNDGRCNHYRSSDGRCGGTMGCGCFVEIKSRLLTEKCPMGRWPECFLD